MLLNSRLRVLLAETYAKAPTQQQPGSRLAAPAHWFSRGRAAPRRLLKLLLLLSLMLSPNWSASSVKRYRFMLHFLTCPSQVTQQTVASSEVQGLRREVAQHESALTRIFTHLGTMDETARRHHEEILLELRSGKANTSAAENVPPE